jgi:phage shock protein C
VTEPQEEAVPEKEVAPAEEAAPANEPQHLLRRSHQDRIIGGVAGGLGRYFGVDPVLIRVAFVVLVFAGGAGLLAYFILWIAVPEEKPGEPVAAHPEAASENRLRDVLGLGLVALGAFFLFKALFGDVLDWKYVWPVVLIAIGMIVLLRGTQRGTQP